MDRAESLIRLAGARSGHLATVRPDGGAHVVVVTFAVSGGSIVTAIDHKPKTTTRLQRLINIEANTTVSFLVDDYDEDWSRLWWVRVDGPATIHDSGAIRETGITALSAKYPQYADRPPQGPLIAISPDRVTGWESTR